MAYVLFLYFNGQQEMMRIYHISIKQCLCKILIIILVRKYFSNFVSVCRPVSLTLCLTICLCLCLCLCVSVCVSIGPSLSLSVSVCVCVCLSDCVCVCECLVCVCVCVCTRALCTVCAETLNGPTSSLVDVICILTVASRVEKG